MNIRIEFIYTNLPMLVPEGGHVFEYSYRIALGSLRPTMGLLMQPDFSYLLLWTYCVFTTSQIHVKLERE